MKIEHLAVWVEDLEAMRSFYEQYFDARSNDLYTNKSKGFSSYFLSFHSGSRLELMRRDEIDRPSEESLGWSHIAFSLGSKDNVDVLTKRLERDGFKIVGGPRTTGDGYYESTIKDPEGNLIELTV